MNSPRPLPSTWKLTPLRELAEYRIGRTPSRARSEYWARLSGDEGVPWVSIADMRQYGVVSSTAERVTPGAVSEIFRGRVSPRGTLLMSFKLTIGRVATLGIDACHNEAIISLFPSSRVDQKFLEYFLSQINYAEYQDRAVKGHTLNQDKIDRLAIAEPPIEEQLRIAAILNSVRRAIDRETALVSHLEAIKRSAMHRLFTRGVRGKQQQESPIGPMPQDWSVKTIRSIARLVAGGTPSRTVPEYWQAGTIPWVKTGEVDYCVINSTEERITVGGLQNSSAKMLPKGTLLIAMYGQGVTRGKVALLGIEACTNQACAAVISASDDIAPKYLYHYLTHSYERLRALSHGAQQQNLNAELVASLEVAVPQDAAERDEIVEVLDAIDRITAVRHQRRTTLRRLFGLLLHSLMTGEIRVDRLDMPAAEVPAA
jgi:type I restriction enzyme, S subunit